MLPQLLDSLKRQVFKFITLPDAQKDPAHKSDPDLAMKDGRTLLDQMLEVKQLKLPRTPTSPTTSSAPLAAEGCDHFVVRIYYIDGHLGGLGRGN